MPSWSKPIVVDGQVVGIACGRSPRRNCSTPGCRSAATIQCDYSVVRKGKVGTCDRWCCRSCAKNVGPNRDYCGAHARGAPK